MSALALLVLEGGDVFYGDHIGVTGMCVGEVVFNTSMTGYQEILTDPSYAEQIITLTYPHIGNTGTNEVDNENLNQTVFAKGLIVRDCVKTPSNYRSQQSLNDFLIQHQVVGIENLDTRALTQLLRAKGSLNGCIMSVDSYSQTNITQALEKVKGFAGLKGMDLAKKVSTRQIYSFNQGSYQLDKQAFQSIKPRYKVAVYDYGVKTNILRLLVDAGCELTVYPAQTPVEIVLKDKPDGVFLSNGPGDPGPCDYAIKNIQTLLEKSIPIFGICLGHQLLALASGAKSQKMKFGHHGANHPVQDLQTKQVAITSQNHGFAVCENGLNESLVVTHRSLFDGSIQGVAQKNKPAFGFQGHPEASPGPNDISYLFTQFSQLMS